MLILVIGGSGSGKSEYAERLALQLTPASSRYYLATMQIWDEECRMRVERHRRQRAGRGFETIECPCGLAQLKTDGLDRSGTILLEDLGNLAANELYAPGADEPKATEAILAGIQSLANQCRHLIIVSNEVAVGGSVYAGDTVRYLHLMGSLHCELARRADAVCEVVNGLPFYYKGRNLL